MSSGYAQEAGSEKSAGPQVGTGLGSMGVRACHTAGLVSLVLRLKGPSILAAVQWLICRGPVYNLMTKSDFSHTELLIPEAVCQVSHRERARS